APAEAYAAGFDDYSNATRLPEQVWHAIGQYLALGADHDADVPNLQLERLCGSTRARRHLPESWPNLPNTALEQMLRGFFDAAGSFGSANEIVVEVNSAR